MACKDITKGSSREALRFKLLVICTVLGFTCIYPTLFCIYSARAISTQYSISSCVIFDAFFDEPKGLCDAAGSHHVGTTVEHIVLPMATRTMITIM